MQTFSVKELGLENTSVMAKEITAKVLQYFKQSKLSQKGNWKILLKAIFFFVGFWAIWYLVIFVDLPVLVKASLCPVGAFFASGIGFCIMHDGGHGAFSKKNWVNKAAAATSESLGVSSSIWGTKHNIVHHDGVNVLGVDEDIEARPFLRLHEGQRWYKIHKYQHRFWWLVYSLLYIIWPLKDFYKYFTGKVMGTRLRFKIYDQVLFWVGKIFFGIMLVAIPIHELGFSKWLWGFVVLFAMPLGFLLSVVFQLAHVVRGVKNSTLEEAYGSDSSEHQISHTANFAPQNWFVRFWTGGLNYQIEHHLFRRIAHIHLPAIHKIVEEACKKYNFPIVIFPTMHNGLVNHIGKLKDLSKKPIPLNPAS